MPFRAGCGESGRRRHRSRSRDRDVERPIRPTVMPVEHQRPTRRSQVTHVPDPHDGPGTRGRSTRGGAHLESVQLAAWKARPRTFSTPDANTSSVRWRGAATRVRRPHDRWVRTAQVGYVGAAAVHERVGTTCPSLAEMSITRLIRPAGDPVQSPSLESIDTGLRRWRSCCTRCRSLEIPRVRVGDRMGLLEAAQVGDQPPRASRPTLMTPFGSVGPHASIPRRTAARTGDRR